MHLAVTIMRASQLVFSSSLFHRDAPSAFHPGWEDSKLIEYFGL